MEVVLIRHAQTPGNLELRYIGGRTDQPLSDKGIETARSVTSYPDVKRVTVSPMRRARHTAEIIFPNAEQIVSEGLREMDFGAFEGRNADEMADNACYRAWVDGGCEGTCPGGENVAIFSARVCAAFETAVKDAEKRGEEKLYIVSHGGTMMAIMGEYGCPERRYYEWRVDNCRGYSAEWSGGKLINVRCV